MNSLGERIACYRKRQNLTQEQLAERCMVTPQAVSKWENGLTTPDIGLLPLLSEIFNVSCDELLGARRAETSAIPAELVDLNKTLIKVRVYGGENTVNVNLPASVAEVVIKSGALCAGEKGDFFKGLDFEQIISIVRMGTVGKIVEIREKDGQTVEVWVE